MTGCVTSALFLNCLQPISTYTCLHPLDSTAHDTTGCIDVHSLTFLSPTYTGCRTGSPVSDQQLSEYWADRARGSPLTASMKCISYVFYHVSALSKHFAWWVTCIGTFFAYIDHMHVTVNKCSKQGVPNWNWAGNMSGTWQKCSKTSGHNVKIEP